MRRIEISAGFNLDPEYTAEMLARSDEKIVNDTAHKDTLNEPLKTTQGSFLATINNLEVESWMALGNCSGKETELFYARTVMTQQPAKEIYRNCVVKEPCLEYALANKDEKGIWGGMNERERRIIRRARGLSKPRNAPRNPAEDEVA